MVLIVSGSCGLLLGAQTGLQIPVESAQVLAGLVKYPADNPFYLYHVKTWTLLHQGCAILLACGLGERVISMMLGGLLGFVSLGGLALCTLAIGRNWLVALFVPLMCLSAKVFNVIQGTYIIYLLSDRPWIYYGAFGTSLVLLIWSLYGVGLRRTGLCLMGVAPALHPTMGAWCLSIGALSLAANWRRERALVRPLAIWWGLGLAIAGASFLFHLYQTSDLPSISPELRAQYVTAFAHGWDMHRQPYPLRDVSIYYALCAAVVGAIWLVCLDRHGDPPQSQADSAVRFLIHSLTISAALGLGLALSTHVLDHLPTTLVMAMPGRYLNVAVLAFPAFAFGVTARYGRHPVAHALLVGAVLYITLREFSHLTHWRIPDVHHALFVMVIAACGCAAKLTPQATVRQAAILRIIPWAAIITLAVLAFWPKHHDRRVTATYLLGAVAVGLPPLCRRLLDLNYVRLLGPIIVAVATTTAASDVLDWPWTIGICLALVAVWASGWWPRHDKLPERRWSPEPPLTPALSPGGRGGYELGPWPALPTPARPTPILTAGRWAIAGGLACVAVWLLGSEMRSGLTSGYQSIRVWQSDPLLRRVHEGKGLVVIAPGVRGMQLRTRRPVLLGPLNQLPYVPESAPAMNHIVQRLYHEDLLKPRPPGHKPDPGGFDAPACRAVFEARGPEEWKELAVEFGFTQIVVRPSWQLQLPLADRSALWALYDVPRDDSPLNHPPAAIAATGERP